MKSLFSILLSLALTSPSLLATAQYPDILIHKGKEHSLFNNPMEAYFEKHPKKKPESGVRSSALWRGYVATFEFKDNAYKAVPRFESVQKLYDAGVLDHSSRNELTKLVSSMSRWVELHEPMFADPENAQAYNREFTPVLDAEFETIRNQLWSIRSLIEKKQAELRQQADDSIESSKIVIEVGMGVAILAACFALWLSIPYHSKFGDRF